jgi:hypothetical protein
MAVATITAAGSGSPEGAITAPIGSLWQQTDGTLGRTLWRKTSGSGNTGWTPYTYFNDGPDDGIRFAKVGGANAYSGASEVQGLGVVAILQPAAGSPAHGLVSEPTLVRASSGTHSFFTSGFFRPPILSGGSATIGTIATLYVTGTNSAGSNNYSLLVESGVSRMCNVFYPQPPPDPPPPPYADIGELALIVGGVGGIDRKALCVWAGDSTSIEDPEGLMVLSPVNNSERTVGVTFGFNGGTRSAAIVAVQKDTSQQSADLVFVTRTATYPGVTAERWRILADGALETSEISDPAAPAAGKARIYVRSTGGGTPKTQLVVRFDSGAIQVIATEP